MDQDYKIRIYDTGLFSGMQYQRMSAADMIPNISTVYDRYVDNASKNKNGLSISFCKI